MNENKPPSITTLEEWGSPATADATDARSRARMRYKLNSASQAWDVRTDTKRERKRKSKRERSTAKGTHLGTHTHNSHRGRMVKGKWRRATREEGRAELPRRPSG